jgi:hypothetical protein
VAFVIAMTGSAVSPNDLHLLKNSSPNRGAMSANTTWPRSEVFGVVLPAVVRLEYPVVRPGSFGMGRDGRANRCAAQTMSEQSRGSGSVRSMQFSLLRILAIVTTICVVSAVLPWVGMIVVAYSPVILAVLLVRHGALCDNDIEFSCGVFLLSVGYIVGSLILAAVFSFLQ